jgi:nucleotide-binding universal stress UspA family protein
MYSRILVPLDGSKVAEGIVPFVGRLARALQSRVELLSVIEEDVVLAIANPMQGRYADQIGNSAVNVAREYLRGLAPRLEMPSGRVSFDVKIASVPQTIIQEASKEADTLIAMSTHGRSGPGRWFLGSVADKELHTTTQPLLLYRTREDERQPANPVLNTIVVPLDGSEMAEQVLPGAVGLARALSLKMTLVRVTPTMAEYYAGEGFYSYPQNLLTAVEEEAKEYLARKAAETKAKGVQDVTTKHMLGAAAIQVVDFVRATPGSFVAICSHGRSGLGRVVLGSVADRIVTHSGAPTLVIKGK